MGNDVFALLTNPVESNDTIISMIESLSQKVIQGDMEIRLIYSYGIVPFNADSKNAEELIKNAEITLYKAKSQDEHHPYYIYDRSLPSSRQHNTSRNIHVKTPT